MSKASTVAVAGGVLIGLNAWTGPQRQAIADVLNGKKSSQGNAHSAWLQLGGEALVVLVATVAAGSSDTVGTGMVAAVVALWILFGINHYAKRNAGRPIAGPIQQSPTAEAA